MNEQQQELLKATELYTKAKNQLEIVQRKYDGIYAQMYLQERITGMKTEEMRKNEMVRIMETEHKDLLDELQSLKGISREAYYKREALAIILGGKAGHHE